VAIAIGAVGAGGWSIDGAAGIGEDLVGWRGLAIAAGLGGGGGLALLAVFYRRPVQQD
jgi:putative oxidoreductase